jgi:hypothetical protein
MDEATMLMGYSQTGGEEKSQGCRILRAQEGGAEAARGGSEERNGGQEDAVTARRVWILDVDGQHGWYSVGC